MDAVSLPNDDPLWYKDAIIYQLHVRSFYDSDDDGIGDFPGLIEKLDYFENLGITAIWLLPFYPSPLKDDGYDISDYTGINPSYGTMEDFSRFVKESHNHGIRVITELVINHTSDQHPWFQRARRSPEGSVERDYYVWSHDINKYRNARIIFKDFENSNWAADYVAGSYYWHRFYSHQPDLNFDNPEVRREIFRVLDFWMRKGVDGLRLDAVPYLFEREGTSCENLPETHRFLKSLRSHMDRQFKNRMLLAEANQWPEDAAAYFGAGDESHMVLHFPIMPRLFMAIKLESRFPITDIIAQTPQVPEASQWGMFLRNHDELTLEMVTDWERDYMYQVYAREREMRINLGIRRRLAPLLGNERRLLELMNSLLFSLPGTPIIYYGDEIGMGDNLFLGDRNGMRTPMQWSADRNAGFSKAPQWRLYLPVVIDPEFHYEAINVEKQQDNPRSLLWWMERAIRVRRQFQAFGRGACIFLRPANPHVLAFIRSYQEQRILVVANLSRFAQSVGLDLGEFAGMTPIELFGGNRFPTLSDTPCVMSLEPYSFYWFSLGFETAKPEIVDGEKSVPAVRLQDSWERLIVREGSPFQQNLLPRFVRKQSWFKGRNLYFYKLEVIDDIDIALENRDCHLLLVQVSYLDGTSDDFLLSALFVPREQGSELLAQSPRLCIALIRGPGRDEGVLFDGFWDGELARKLLWNIFRKRAMRGDRGNLSVSFAQKPASLIKTYGKAQLTPIIESSGTATSVRFDTLLLLRIFRNIEPESRNPEFQLWHYLSAEAAYPNILQLLATLSYAERGREPGIAAILYRSIENQGTAWDFTLDYLDRYFENSVRKKAGAKEMPKPMPVILAMREKEPPQVALELFGDYLQEATVLGRRTAEMHAALCKSLQNRSFFPEEFTPFFQQSFYQSLRGLSTRVFRLLRARQGEVPDRSRPALSRLFEAEARITGKLNLVRNHRFTSQRIRIHGNYKLDKLLHTGKDYVLADFEGEAWQSVSERNEKGSVFRDLVAMVRSFHHASQLSMVRLNAGPAPLRTEEMEPWRALWFTWTSAAFLKEYIAAAAGSSFLSAEGEEHSLLWETFFLERALSELSAELAGTPEAVGAAIEETERSLVSEIIL